MKTILPLLLLLPFAAASANAAVKEKCSERMARDARDAIDTAKDWNAMYVWYTNYARCDSTEVRRAYADRTARLLVFEWPHFNHLTALWIFDKKFQPFILDHIDSTIAPDLLQKMANNARTYCPSRSADKCLLILSAAETAAAQDAAIH